jgi:acyl-CoA thioester hydrolase
VVKSLVPHHDVPQWTDIARVRVLHADTDAMGVVYHASYLRWMEHGRVELVRQNGVQYASFEAQGLALPVTELAVKYLAGARYDDLVTIRAAVVGHSGVRVIFGYQLAVEVGGRPGLARSLPVLTAETRHACISLQTGRPTRLPEPLIELLQRVCPL